MAISDVIEKLGKVIFEAPFGGTQIVKDAPELAEIRLAVLDAARAKSHRAGGKSVFPYSVIRVRLLGVPLDKAALFQSDFLRSYFAQELKSSLHRASHRFPDDLRVEMLTSPELPLPGDEWIVVEAEVAQHSAEEPSIKPRKPAKLTVLSGTANRPEISLTKNRMNIGRTVEVFRGSGPSRRNDLAFVEDSDVNRTVSREHAHIVHSPKAGEYRLVNDRSYKGENNCGLWIVRDGLSQPVHRGERGTLLQNGDEIHLGSAMIRFQMK